MSEMEHEQLPYKERVISICICGRPLYPALNENNERIGVTHEIEDEDHHCRFLASLRVVCTEKEQGR